MSFKLMLSEDEYLRRSMSSYYPNGWNHKMHKEVSNLVVHWAGEGDIIVPRSGRDRWFVQQRATIHLNKEVI